MKFCLLSKNLFVNSLLKFFRKLKIIPGLKMDWLIFQLRSAVRVLALKLLIVFSLKYARSLKKLKKNGKHKKILFGFLISLKVKIHLMVARLMRKVYLLVAPIRADHM